MGAAGAGNLDGIGERDEGAVGAGDLAGRDGRDEGGQMVSGDA